MEQKEHVVSHDDPSADDRHDELLHQSSKQTLIEQESLKSPSPRVQSLKLEESEESDELDSDSEAGEVLMLEQNTPSDAPVQAVAEPISEEKTSTPQSKRSTRDLDIQKTEQVEDADDSDEDEDDTETHSAIDSEQPEPIETLEPPSRDTSRPHTEELDALELPKLTRHEPSEEHRDSKALSSSSQPEESESESDVESEAESDGSEDYIRTKTPRGSLASIPDPVSTLPHRASHLISTAEESTEPEELEEPEALEQVPQATESEHSTSLAQRTSSSSLQESLLSSVQDEEEEAVGVDEVPSSTEELKDSSTETGLHTLAESPVPQEDTKVTVKTEEVSEDSESDLDDAQEHPEPPVTNVEIAESIESTEPVTEEEDEKPLVQPGIALDEPSQPRPESLATLETEPTPPSPVMLHDSMVTVRLSESDVYDSELDKSTNATVPRTFQDVLAEKRPPLETIETSNLLPRGSLITLAPRKLSSSTLGKSRSERGSSDSEEEVDWDNLEKTEDAQAKDEDTDNVSLAQPFRWNIQIADQY